ncbi:MAG TPA: protein kinase [Ignavibacteriaceae bacterium]|nr:protein kinase [Ignavibacteriaceae bacterium]
MDGSIILHYKILRKLGEGGMGVVYLAEDTKLERKVAIKFLPKHIAGNSEDRERFKIEAKATAALNHPNIATIYAIEESVDDTFIVMEYIDGIELKEKIKSGPVAIKEAVNIAIQIAEGLGAAHKKGVVHRDIKSQNVMLTDEGKVKIMDFGLAKMKGGIQLTKVESTVGTVAYMSPEQARGEKVDHRTDIWSFGIVLYEMLTGNLPFPGEYDQAIVYSILNEKPELENNIPDGLKLIIDKVLEKNPNDRYQNGKDLVSDLSMLVHSNKSQNSTLSSGINKKNRTSHRTKVISGIVTTFGIAVIIFLLLINNESKIKSLAVLPFENLQKDSSVSFLADGIPENLINRIGSFQDVKVFARSATFNLDDTSKSINSIKRLLNPDAVLTGQLMQNNGVYYLSCQLVNTENQNQIWGNKYELTNNNISKIEDSIIASLMNPLQITLVDKPKGLQQKKQVKPSAYAEYMKGRYLSYGSTPEESEKALAHFRQAIRIDPTYAEAYAAIANEKIVQTLFLNAPQQEIINEARIAIEAAKALDPNLPEIYTSEGALKFYYDWDWQGAVESYKKALELDPNNANIYIRYSATLADVGRYEEALPLANKAVELDPVSISSLHNLGWTNLVASNFQKSASAFGKALELHPNWIWGYIKQAYAYLFLHEYDKALPNASKAEKLFKDGWGSELLQVTLAFIYSKCNQKEKFSAVMNRFMKYTSENTLKDPWDLSYIYYLKGDYQKAYEWEEKSIATRSFGAYLLNIKIFYDKKYFNSPEHQKILKKMGFVK